MIGKVLWLKASVTALMDRSQAGGSHGAAGPQTVIKMLSISKCEIAETYDMPTHEES